MSTKMSNLDEQKVKVIAKREFDPLVREQLKKDLGEFVKIYDQKFGPESLQEFRITIQEMHKEGRREEFEVQATLFTDFGDFHTQREGWDLVEIFGKIITAIKKQTFP